MQYCFQFLLVKFRLKLNKVGKTTRPFRYDLNQIPYDYTVKVRNRFKGLDLIDRVPDELWAEVHDIGQETGIKTISRIGGRRFNLWATVIYIKNNLIQFPVLQMVTTKVWGS